MAYNDIASPAEVMGREITMTRNLLDAIANSISKFGRAIMANSAGQRRIDRVERLRAKSDAELAELNIKRDDIVHYVFKDIYYV
ncbi:DUF1127 domain-containing protein [Sulfitobacter mediterraneus]|uniref:DUF1127 domain-containing protein n=1 Tax=Sulfitobacter mediterraneus TaxID=83219 RepID=UPI001931D4BA|nr:DUF1127 domain-containing protein [Sulfitobacter mediterraneus]MBM1632540.1 DUF1127 domain-containing protein [Sulfitobacter mediterraneus]MBM1640357.1 DUF1127 domain-containing protein [Sulfitobacter mediterraneus]MBM1644405.1 DUF1127 domain-containing protein [Sulfitobacter mediterraneus]MBM1648452.1 DUF1127 domain-containing protein [Sulfitobacter mediterraneus]MBM1652497.1 DUF1127 domain-containing protein [Sulfitobacter mediterraneus]